MNPDEFCCLSNQLEYSNPGDVPTESSSRFGLSAFLFSSLYYLLITGLLLGATLPLYAQDRLPTLPGYEQYRTQSRKLREAILSASTGILTGGWSADNRAYIYRKEGKAYRYDLHTGQNTETEETPPRRSTGSGGAGGFLERGRQATVSISPDNRFQATYRDGNITITATKDPKNLEPKRVTTNGGHQSRLFYGTASWVYGEELEQRSAMWWSPDSKTLAYYGFDESKVQDYFLPLNQLDIQNRLDTEPYPKAGANNPVVDLYLYDVETSQNIRIDVRDGKPFNNEVVGHYVYNVRWSPDGRELLFYRTNRLQNLLEFVAADPKTGHCRVILRESWPTSWTTNLPVIQFLKDGNKDGNRFVWASDRTGWRNLYLYDLSGKLLTTLTAHKFDVDRIVRIDEQVAPSLFYTAHDGDNPMKLQLHRVGLDGQGEIRLTDPKLNHRIDLSPDGRYFVDIAQSHDIPASTRIVSVPEAAAPHITILAQGDLERLKSAGFANSVPEMFTYKATDGATDLYGLLFKPSNFDPKRKYPLLVDVYAGPETPQAEMVSENFFRPHALTEMGFLVAVFDGRGTTRRGKAFMDAVYGKLGQAEIDDQATGVKFLRQRPYVDGAHVGIYGTSYGGYASLMCILRYPDVFQAASASSAVTDWRNYDSIYTERFMGLPQDNPKGYTAGAAATYAANLKGKLLLYYGTSDNNVHPANTLQLIAALDRAGKSYELRVGPDAGHSGVNQDRMLEFFVENLK